MAAQRLNNDGYGVDLLKINLLKPADFTEVMRAVLKTGRLLVVEDCAEQGSMAAILRNSQGRDRRV
jgi:pyruvate/2-oxoglutarate/acetoin dehydrogenase E1 component